MSSRKRVRKKHKKAAAELPFLTHRRKRRTAGGCRRRRVAR
ncbi:MAG: hypothetical protein ACK4SY_07175 [Pyrobaculum sp.]